MTVWRAGMLAAAVGVKSRPDVWREGEVVRVSRVFVTRRGLIGLNFFRKPEAPSGVGWCAECFRPLVSDDDDAELIARIKRCKPAKAPVITERRHERAGYGEAL